MQSSGAPSPRPGRNYHLLRRYRSKASNSEQDSVRRKQLLDQIKRSIGFQDQVDGAKCRIERITAQIARAAEDLTVEISAGESEDQIARLLCERQAGRQNLDQCRTMLNASHTAVEALVDLLRLDQESSALAGVLARMRYASSLIRRSRGLQARRAQLHDDLELLRLALLIDAKSRTNSWTLRITTKYRRRMMNVRDAIAAHLEARLDRLAGRKAEQALERFYLLDAHRLIKHLDQCYVSPKRPSDIVTDDEAHVGSMERHAKSPAVSTETPDDIDDQYTRAVQSLIERVADYVGIIADRSAYLKRHRELLNSDDKPEGKATRHALVATRLLNERYEALKRLDAARDEYVKLRDHRAQLGLEPQDEDQEFAPIEILTERIDFDLRPFPEHPADGTIESAGSSFRTRTRLKATSNNMQVMLERMWGAMPEDATSDVTVRLPSVVSWDGEHIPIKPGFSRNIGGYRAPSAYMTRLKRDWAEKCNIARVDAERVRREKLRI